MTATFLAAPAPMPLASFRRSPAVPMPWHASAGARRAAALLAPAQAARRPRVETALRRGSAFNAVARERLFAAISAAAGPGVVARRHAARRHALLTLRVLGRELPHAHAPDEQPGIAADTLVCLTGKRIDMRAIARLLEVTHHACGRFVQRSGRTDANALHAAILEAASHALPVLVAHLDGGLAPRLRTGSAPVLLPAGEGAFLGRLRLLPLGPQRAAVPVIEAASWLHLAWLDTPQVQARDVLLAGLSPSELVAALPAAWAALQGNAGGDRRLRAGLDAVPFPTGADRRTRLALACCPAMAAARVELGLACADTIAAEWDGAS